MHPMDPIQAAHVAKIVRMCQLISTIVALYDHLLTLGQEVELVWNKPCTPARTMFLWNRYFGSLFLLINGILFSIPSYGDILISMGRPNSIFSCYPWFIFQGCGTAIIIWSMQSTMLFRTHAMYPYSPFIRCATRICFICEVVSMAIILIFAFIKFKASNLATPASSFCTTYNIPSFLYAFWIPVIALDCVFFLLTAWFVFLYRSRGASDAASSNLILETLMWDSLSYFLVTLLTYGANAVVWIIFPARLIGLPQAFSIAGTCIMGIRLVLNLRGAYYSHSMGSATCDEVGADPITSNGDAGVIAVTFRAPSRVSTVSSKIEDLSYP